MTIDDKMRYFCVKTSEHSLLETEEIFGNINPITLEIGTGKGEYIAAVSKLHPERNYLGLELRDKRIITTLKKLDIDTNKNVRLLRLLVDSTITQYLKPSTIDEMIIYHADPWPKKRHHKHRLFQHKFIDAISHVLKNDCLLKVSTDDENYKDWILTLFGERHDFENMYHDKFSSVPPIDHITTYFDKKKAMEGFETYFMLFKKIS